MHSTKQTNLDPITLMLFQFQNDWHYNSYTAHYFWWKKRFRLIEVFRKFLRSSNKTSLRILDLGCGGGYDLFLIAKEIDSRDIRLFGIDINPNYIKYARRRTEYEGCSNIMEFCLVDIRELSERFLPDTFDFIICSEVIEHLQDPKKAVLDCLGLLAPGGQAVITTPNARNAISKFVSCLGLKKRQSEVSVPVDRKDEAGYMDYGHISLKNYRDWAKLFHACGLRIVNIQRGPLVYGCSWLDQKSIVAGLLIALDGLIDKFFSLPQLAYSTIFLLEKPSLSK